MEYKIIINSQGRPMLVDMPEKPNCSCYSCTQAYKQVITTALADESKHIHFKNEDWAIKHFFEDCKFDRGPGNIITMDGYAVSFEKGEIPCPDNIEGCEVLHMQKVAILKLEPHAKEEPIKGTKVN